MIMVMWNAVNLQSSINGREMIKKTLLLCLTIVLCQSGLAQEFRKSGTSGFAFLQIPVSARYAALGDAGITLSNVGADGLFVNPALVVLSDAQLSLSATHANWYVDTKHQALGVAYHLRGVGAIGISVINFDFGDIPRTANYIPGIFEPSANETSPFAQQGSYTAGATAFGVSLSRSLTAQFAFGATLKYVQESIDNYDASNVIADIGFLYFTGFHSMRVGAFLQNFGLETQYANEKFKMPQQLRLEISAELIGDLASPNRLTLIADAAQANDADERLHIGAEATLMNAVVLRSGYKFGYDYENLTLGLGLNFMWSQKRVGLDLAYMNHDLLESTVRTTVNLEL
ncbi:MAG: PorV/PorQ family protein [Calditrichia bacterium]